MSHSTSVISHDGWRVSEVPFKGILASALSGRPRSRPRAGQAGVQPSVSLSDASISIPRLLEIRPFHLWLKPLFTFCSSLRAAQPPAVSQNANADLLITPLASL